MIKLLEPELLVYCNKEDLNMLKQIIPECEKQYKEIMERETSDEKTYETKLTLKENDFIPNSMGAECGGVVLMTTDRRIVCNNTL